MLSWCFETFAEFVQVSDRRLSYKQAQPPSQLDSRSRAPSLSIQKLKLNQLLLKRVARETHEVVAHQQDTGVSQTQSQRVSSTGKDYTILHIRYKPQACAHPPNTSQVLLPSVTRQCKSQRERKQLGVQLRNANTTITESTSGKSKHLITDSVTSYRAT